MKDKLLIELSKITNLKYIEKPTSLYGEYRGYNISITNINWIYVIDFPIKVTDDSKIPVINDFLNNLKNEYVKLNVASYKNYAIKLQFNAQNKKHREPEKLALIINSLIDFAIYNSLNTCCEFCGDVDYISPFLIENSIIPCCKNCQLEIKNNISESQNEFQVKSNNIVGGIVGGLLGSLIGSILWIIIAQMNYISGIAGLAIAVCCIKGYQLFGGKLNKSGIIITSIITLFMVYFANHISLAIIIYTELSDFYSLNIFDSLISVPYFLEEQELRNAFIRDLLVGYALTIAGSVYYIKNSYKQANFKIKADEVEI